jgi:hypothetical protein
MGTQNIKTRPDALVTTENESGRAKPENSNLHPWYRQKRVQERKAWKQNPTPSEKPKKSPGMQNMKTGSDALRTAENVSGNAKHKTGVDTLGTAENVSVSAKHENGTRRPRNRRKRVRERKPWKRDPTPSAPPETCPGAQNIKQERTPTVPSKTCLGLQIMKTTFDALGAVKTSPRAQIMKTGPDALGFVENMSGSAKHENGTRRRLYRRKRLRGRKT